MKQTHKIKFWKLNKANFLYRPHLFNPLTLLLSFFLILNSLSCSNNETGLVPPVGGESYEFYTDSLVIVYAFSIHDPNPTYRPLGMIQLNQISPV